MSTKEVSNKKINRNTRKERKPFYNDNSRFRLPKIDGYHVCLIEEITGKIQQYIDAGYIFVKENTDELIELDREQELKDSSEIWRVEINPSYAAVGTPKGIVMAIKEEWFREDQEAKAAQERASRQGNKVKDDKIF